MATRTYLVMVNAYRNSTSSGFANTWRPMRCADRAAQARVLRGGLPVNDCWLLDNDGGRSACYSSMGIRPAMADERREAKRLIEAWGRDAVPMVA